MLALGYEVEFRFDAMFLHATDTVVELFAPELASAPPGELDLIAGLFHDADRSFVFTHASFVVRFLERCAEVDPQLLTRAKQSFFSSAISGVRGGVLGEPTAEDLDQRARATEMLNRLSVVSPAYELYDWIRGSAQASMA